MVNTSRMLVSTNKRDNHRVSQDKTLSSQNYIAQILFLTTTHNRHRLNPDLSCLPQCKGINNIVLICGVQSAYSVDERKQEKCKTCLWNLSLVAFCSVTVIYYCISTGQSQNCVITDTFIDFLYVCRPVRRQTAVSESKSTAQSRNRAPTPTSVYDATTCKHTSEKRLCGSPHKPKKLSNADKRLTSEMNAKKRETGKGTKNSAHKKRRAARQADNFRRGTCGSRDKNTHRNIKMGRWKHGAVEVDKEGKKSVQRTKLAVKWTALTLREHQSSPVCWDSLVFCNTDKWWGTVNEGLTQHMTHKKSLYLAPVTSF